MEDRGWKIKILICYPQFSILNPLFSIFIPHVQPLGQVFFADGDQADIAGTFAQDFLDFEHQFFLVSAAQFSFK
jgi:hypothetical protein